MTARVLWTAVLMLVVCGAESASAQADRQFGLTMGYPTAVGVLWHVTDRAAIRPEIDLSRTSVTTESSSPLGPDDRDEATSRLIRPGVSLLLYLTSGQDLRTYVSPRFSYTSTDSSQSDIESSTYLVSGSLGAQHRLGDRFAVFGELGIEYSRSTSRLSVPQIISSTIRRSTVGTRSGAGIVLYF